MQRLICIGLLAALMVSLQPHNALAELSEKALKLEALYSELQGFKDDPEFHRAGYACCRFNTWLQEVKILHDENGLESLRELGFVPDDLRILGREYMNSEGMSTSFAIQKEVEISDALSR